MHRDLINKRKQREREASKKSVFFFVVVRPTHSLPIRAAMTVDGYREFKNFSVYFWCCHRRSSSQRLAGMRERVLRLLVSFLPTHPSCPSLLSPFSFFDIRLSKPTTLFYTHTHKHIKIHARHRQRKKTRKTLIPEAEVEISELPSFHFLLLLFFFFASPVTHILYH